MKGKGVSTDRSQSTSWSGKGKRTLKPCRGKGKSDGVVLIDVDNDDYDEVIIIDVPESFQQQFRGPRVFGKDRNFPFPPVITVDDDDSNPAVHPENNSEDSDFLDSDDDSNKSSPAANFDQGSVDANAEVFHRNESALKSSKREQTCHDKGRNRYGLGLEYESSSSESDSSDCEVLDGSPKELREQWEKVFQKRQCNVHNGHSRTDDQTRASTSSYKHPNVGVESRTEQPIDAHVCFSSGIFPFGEGNGSTSSPASGIMSVVQQQQQEASIPPSGVGYMDALSLSTSIVPVFQEDVINDREKLKETDEYKRAVEEEWASRQQQLQIQAEEAQRQRKRKKAERMRLLDMERRQKLRVEEVRETQKKDEENMNKKEQLRAEVRKNLNKLEMTSINMVSLLRSLGIPVGGGFCPSSPEVHAAYKRALLKFHPDRTSRMDIKQQVESEEKFKLISRMKEKFLST